MDVALYWPLDQVCYHSCFLAWYSRIITYPFEIDGFIPVIFITVEREHLLIIS
jgi:hypothetical protein